MWFHYRNTWTSDNIMSLHSIDLNSLVYGVKWHDIIWSSHVSIVKSHDIDLNSLVYGVKWHDIIWSSRVSVAINKVFWRKTLWVEQQLLILLGQIYSLSILSGVRVALTLVSCVFFVYHTYEQIEDTKS
jgi:hypothetical protein